MVHLPFMLPIRLPISILPAQYNQMVMKFHRFLATISSFGRMFVRIHRLSLAFTCS